MTSPGDQHYKHFRRSKYTKKIRKVSEEPRFLKNNAQKRDSLKPIKFTIPDVLFQSFKPFQNLALFPKALQAHLSQGKPQEEAVNCIYSLRTPNDIIAFSKKISKLKLLAVGQENLVKNLLKGKATDTMSAESLKALGEYSDEHKKLAQHINELYTLLSFEAEAQRQAFFISLSQQMMIADSFPLPGHIKREGFMKY